MKEINYDGPSLDEGRKKIPQGFGSAKIRVLRTYEADAIDAVKNKNVSKASMILAEEKRREDRGEERTIKRADEIGRAHV